MRFKSYLSGLDLNKRTLEIGPLDNPVLSKSEADVYYSDILSTDEVKALYNHDTSVNKDEICEIDFVIRDSYTTSLKSVPGFDYIISSHVIEHIPRVIEFFQDIVNVLNTKGQMYFFLPDSRYCFDRFRFPTSFAELYYIHTQGISVAPWQVLDFHNMYIPLNDPHILSTNRKMHLMLSHRHSFSNAKQKFEATLKGEYITAHYSVFTPESFLLIIHDLVRAGLFPFKLISFFPTPQYDHTFGGVLEVCKEMLEDVGLADQEMKKIRTTLLQVADFETKLIKSR